MASWRRIVYTKAQNTPKLKIGKSPSHRAVRLALGANRCISYLQDIACKACGAVLGLRCDSAPEGHLLKRFDSVASNIWGSEFAANINRDQLILRLAEMSVISERTGTKATASVIERFPLILAGTAKPPRAARASTVQPSHRAGTPSVINHRHATSSMLPPIDERQLQELEKFKDWAKSAIQTQQHDIDRIGGAVDRMERDLKSFKIFMEEIRAEVITHRQAEDSQKDEELGVLKRDLRAIQTELNSNRQFRNSLKEEEFPVLQEDMDALRSEVAQARQFQRELKDQDIKTLQQDVHGLRHSLEGIAYLTEDGPKVSQEKFETLVDDVREVDRKSNDIYALKTELEQFQARLVSMETAVQDVESSVRRKVQDQEACSMSQNESRNAVSNISRQPVRSNVDRAYPSFYEREEGRDQSVTKRRHFEMETNVDNSHGPPTKRPMPGKPSEFFSPGNSASTSLTVRFRNKNSPIILSSNHGTPSPILDRRTSQRVRNGNELTNQSMNTPIDFNKLDSLLDNSRPSPKPLSTRDIMPSNAHLQSSTPNGALNNVSNSTRTTLINKDLRRRHPTSALLAQAQESGEKPHRAIKATSSKENRRPRNFRERSDTPDQLSTLSADEAMQKSVQKRASGGSGIRKSKIFGSSSIAAIGKVDIPRP